MNHKLAASVLGALVYAQALLGIAALGAVIVRHHGAAAVVAMADGPAETAVR